MFLKDFALCSCDFASREVKSHLPFLQQEENSTNKRANYRAGKAKSPSLTCWEGDAKIPLQICASVRVSGLQGTNTVLTRKKGRGFCQQKLAQSHLHRPPQATETEHNVCEIKSWRVIWWKKMVKRKKNNVVLNGLLLSPSNVTVLISLTEKLVCACVYVVSYKERFRNKIFDRKQRHVS